MQTARHMTVRQQIDIIYTLLEVFEKNKYTNFSSDMWLCTHNKDLNGIPRYLMNTDEGLLLVYNYLMFTGVYKND